jgi:cobalt-zinc-cadmium efflux system membrane fusion protein
MRRDVGRGLRDVGRGFSPGIGILALAMSSPFIEACERKSASSAAAPAAAKVANPRPESEISTVTLTPEAEKHLALETATVGTETVALSRMVSGEAIVPPGRAVVVTAPVAGTAVVPSGRAELARVQRGDVLFELVPFQQPERDSRAGSERHLKEAQAKLTAATQRLQRLEQLLKEGATSARNVEEARADHTVAAAAVEAAQAEVTTLARLPLGSRGELAITAPFNGRVTAVRIASGQAVAAGAPLADVAQIGTLWVRVPVYAGDLAAVDAGKPAAVGALGQESSGAWQDVRPVAGPPSADPSASSADLFFELPNPKETFRPGERLSVRLPLKGTETSMVIPRSAVVYDLTGGAWVYEARAPHVFARRRIEIAGQSATGVIVRRGLANGVRIVTVGAAELYGTEFFVSK